MHLWWKQNWQVWDLVGSGVYYINDHSSRTQQTDNCKMNKVGVLPSQSIPDWDEDIEKSQPSQSREALIPVAHSSIFLLCSAFKRKEELQLWLLRYQVTKAGKKIMASSTCWL